MSFKRIWEPKRFRSEGDGLHGQRGGPLRQGGQLDREAGLADETVRRAALRRQRALRGRGEALVVTSMVLKIVARSSYSGMPRDCRLRLVASPMPLVKFSSEYRAEMLPRVGQLTVQQLRGPVMVTCFGSRLKWWVVRAIRPPPMKAAENSPRAVLRWGPSGVACLDVFEMWSQSPDLALRSAAIAEMAKQRLLSHRHIGTDRARDWGDDACAKTLQGPQHIYVRRAPS